MKHFTYLEVVIVRRTLITWLSGGKQHFIVASSRHQVIFDALCTQKVMVTLPSCDTVLIKI